MTTVHHQDVHAFAKICHLRREFECFRFQRSASMPRQGTARGWSVISLTGVSLAPAGVYELGTPPGLVHQTWSVQLSSATRVAAQYVQKIWSRRAVLHALKHTHTHTPIFPHPAGSWWLAEATDGGIAQSCKELRNMQSVAASIVRAGSRCVRTTCFKLQQRALRVVWKHAAAQVALWRALDQALCFATGQSPCYRNAAWHAFVAQGKSQAACPWDRDPGCNSSLSTSELALAARLKNFCLFANSLSTGRRFGKRSNRARRWLSATR